MMDITTICYLFGGAIVGALVGTGITLAFWYIFIEPRL